MPQKMPPILVMIVETLIPTLAAIVVFAGFAALTGKSWGGAPVGVIAGVVGPMQFTPAMLAKPLYQRRLIGLASAVAGASAAIAALSLIG